MEENQGVTSFWLDKRRDGKSAAISQIAWYERGTVLYRSTRQRDLEAAKAELRAHDQAIRSKGKQDGSQAVVFALLKLYWQEHGRRVVSPAQIESSIRVFTGFMIQDEIGADATVDRLTPAVFERFRVWRMQPHEWEVPWYGKRYATSSPGVKGETVQPNLNDIRAALMHHQRNGRITAPFVPSVPAQFRSPPRDRVLSLKELGSIVGYARHFPDLYRWIALMLATAARPEAGLAFDPSVQRQGAALDLHPRGWAVTKKVNPVVPLIADFEPLLDDWPVSTVSSRKRAWRTMRRALGLSDDVYPKTPRHTMATMLLDDAKVDPIHIEAMFGHRIIRKQR